MKKPRKQLIGLEVGGKDPNLWQKLKPKFIRSLNKLLNTVINTDTNATVKQEAQKFTNLLLDYGKQKLAKPGLDNEKTLAEIELLYSQKQREHAETRKIHAEADALELQTTIRKLKLYLGMAKLLLAEGSSSETIVFVKEIDSFIDTLNQLETGDSHLLGE